MGAWRGVASLSLFVLVSVNGNMEASYGDISASVGDDD